MEIDVYGILLGAMGVLFASAIITPIFSKWRKLAGIINLILVSVAAAALLYTAYSVIFTGIKGTAEFINFGPFGLYFLLDSFSALFVGIISFMAIISAIYSIQYMEHYPEYSLRSYYISYPLFILGMVALVTVDDLSIGFSIAWQLMTIASYFLIRFEYKKKENLRGANKYLLLMEVAWAFVIAATLIIGDFVPGESIHHLTEKLAAVGMPVQYTVYGLLLVGFGFKAGVFPLGQLWLPDAHSIAPSPISALLSGVMLKTGIYGIFRTFFWMVPHGSGHHISLFWGFVIASLGVVTLFIGTVQSMKQSDSKRLLAYSSIGQIGYIIFAIGSALVMFSSNDTFIQSLSIVAVAGAVYHIFNHAVFKGLLFLNSGSILYATGTKDLNKLGGLLTLMPISAFLAGLASLSIAGVPPFSGFFSKWSIIASSLLGGTYTAVLVIFGIIALFTSPITLACYIKFFGMSFTGAGTEWNVKKDVKEVPASMLFPKVILVLLSIAQGLLPFTIYKTIITVFQNSKGSIISEFFNTFEMNNFLQLDIMGIQIKSTLGSSIAAASPVIVIIVVALAFALGRFLRGSGGSKETTAETWLCGYQNLNNFSRYTSRSMFSALKKFFWWTGGNVKDEK